MVGDPHLFYRSEGWGVGSGEWKEKIRSAGILPARKGVKKIPSAGILPARKVGKENP
jgi:hypothetical protein